jgi:PAS domain S-box-containing protein
MTLPIADRLPIPIVVLDSRYNGEITQILATLPDYGFASQIVMTESGDPSLLKILANLTEDALFVLEAEHLPSLAPTIAHYLQQSALGCFAGVRAEQPPDPHLSIEYPINGYWSVEPFHSDYFLLGLLAILRGYDNSQRRSPLREMKAALHDSEERFRIIFEQAGVGINIVYLDGIIAQVNPKYCEILGYTPEELIGNPFYRFSAPTESEADRQHSQPLAAGEIDQFIRDKRYRRKDGQEIWASLTVSLVRKADGEPDYSIGIIEDISDRRQIEDHLRQQERKLREITAQVPGMVFRLVLDESGHYTLDFVSDGAQAIYELSPEAIAQAAIPPQGDRFGG